MRTPEQLIRDKEYSARLNRAMKLALVTSRENPGKKIYVFKDPRQAHSVDRFFYFCGDSNLKCLGYAATKELHAICLNGFIYQEGGAI